MIDPADNFLESMLNGLAQFDGAFTAARLVLVAMTRVFWKPTKSSAIGDS